MSTREVTLIVQAGIIPEETLKQLVAWKMLPPEVLKGAGSRKASSVGWDAEKFVAHLRDIIEKESEAIRETEYVSPGKPVQVSVKMKGRALYHGEAYQDRLGRIYLDSRFYGKAIESIIVAPEKQPRRVEKVEERFKGERPEKVVCYLEER